jgi:alcohol dehydrogenase class IV
MPAILELLRDECAVQLERIAPAFGVETGADVPKALEDVMRRCEIPRLSTAIGLDSRVIPDLVELVQGESRLIALSRRQPTDEEWEQVFAKSM